MREARGRDGQGSRRCVLRFFLKEPATTEIYTLSLHDALPIRGSGTWFRTNPNVCCTSSCNPTSHPADRKSTRLNSSHLVISYAVFCLNNKKGDAARGDHCVRRHVCPIVRPQCRQGVAIAHRVRRCGFFF